MELLKSVVLLFSVVAFCEASKTVLCNKYPPLIGFEIDKVSFAYNFESLIFIHVNFFTWQNSELNVLWKTFFVDFTEYLQYLGRWWQMEKTPTVSELPGKCWSSFYYRDAANPEKVKLRMDYVTRL